MTDKDFAAIEQRIKTAREHGYIGGVSITQLEPPSTLSGPCSRWRPNVSKRLTEAALAESERALQLQLALSGSPSLLAGLWQITAEVRRLQWLITQAEWKAAPVEDCFEELACPWCAALPSDSPEGEEPRHKPTCPAFGSET